MTIAMNGCRQLGKRVLLCTHDQYWSNQREMMGNMYDSAMDDVITVTLVPFC